MSTSDRMFRSTAGGGLKRSELKRTEGPKRKGWIKRGTKPLPFQSAKRSREQRQRRKLAEAMQADGHPTCFIPGCNRFADDGHELLSRARGGSITDPANVVPVCRDHHNEITTNPTWAEVNGYALKTGRLPSVTDRTPEQIADHTAPDPRTSLKPRETGDH